jgi:hydrogenase large subunit
MATTITIDPLTRIEGHLEIEVTVDTVRGVQQVVDARAAGKMFRGFEVILIGRDPRDAPMYTQRICGVCPVSHALASSLNLDQAFAVTPPDNARILRNLVLAANFIQSHVLHFYHLSALDYIDTTGLLDMAPWTPRFVTPDMATGTKASTLVSHYVGALEMRRKAHQAGAVFGGKLPCLSSFVVGGVTQTVTAEKIAEFRALLNELRAFIDNVYVPDAQTLGSLFPAYYGLGAGNSNLMAFGVFDLNAAGTSKLFGPGRYTDGTAYALDPAEITEHVTHAWYTPESGGTHPADATTVADADKPGAYSWLKAPRLQGQAHEAGPLARMWISGRYTNGISAMDRIVARALETQLLANTMDTWLDELVPGAPVYVPSAIPASGVGAGLTEAPRGALGHWMTIADSAISRYQVITPTTWNASPRDDADQPGPIETALIGVPVADLNQPIEVLRVVHTFDPCLACAVHLVRPNDRRGGARVLLRPSVG